MEHGYASIAFMIPSSAIVMVMTPAVGLYYSGQSRSHHALTIIMLSCLSYAITTVQWTLLGFSLAFSENAYNGFIGNLDYAFFQGVNWQAFPLTAPAIPSIALANYQLQFATITVALVFGSVVERIRVLPCMLFMFVFATLVYCPIAYWTWGARGWIKNMSCLSTLGAGDTPCQIGALDFAGGGPVHMASGAASLAFCLFLGQRKRHPEDSDEEFKPHSVASVFLGTALLWMGWFGFNGGSALAASSRAAYAATCTTIAASTGALFWCVIEYAFTRKFSGVGFCSGAIAGLVGITPASGFVDAWAALLIGAITASVCFFNVRLKAKLGYDDAIDAWGVHGFGGFVGNICTGLFASRDIAALDGSVIAGGVFVNGEWALLGYNVLAALATICYSFVLTLMIVAAINRIPRLHFRLDEHMEFEGGDLHQMGEEAFPEHVILPRRRSRLTSSTSINNVGTLLAPVPEDPLLSYN